MNLSEHLTLEEITYSNTANSLNINNDVPDDMMSKAYHLASFFEEIRSILKVPIKIDSGYRCPELNKAVKGVPTSQHCKLEALDMVPQGLGMLESFHLLIEKDLNFHQLILEGISSDYPMGKWIHAGSLVESPNDNKHTILLCNSNKKYTPLTKDQALNWVLSQKKV